MVLSIKDAEANALARRLARETGESLTAVVTQALRERLERLGVQRGRRGAVQRILQAAWTLPRLDTRTPDEILGYDANGLPR